MATQKKTGGSRAVSGGGRSSSSRSGGGSRAKSPARGRQSAPQRPVRREVGAVVCLLLVMVSTAYLVGQSYNPFLYFRF